MDTIPRRPGLEATSSPELVRLALHDHGVFKLVAVELQGRPPDPAATRLVIELFRSGDAPPWLAAVLLGSVRGSEGYAVAREILVAAPRLLAESYAGRAMVQILGPSARTDLVAIMGGTWPRRTCEGAAYALARMGDPDVLDDVLRAVRARRIGASCAASVVAAVPGATALVTAWLAGDDPCKEDVAIEAAETLSARPGGMADRALAEAVRESLDAGRVKVAPRVRRMLAKRAAIVLDS